jgi:glycosyltransferase involved in cell wall biosynthesis
VIRLLHLITDLEVGGAEFSLLRLLTMTDKSRFDVRVVSMVKTGGVRPQVESLGVPVQDLSMKYGVPSPFALARLIRLIREWRPDLIQTWMYHADLLGSLAAAMAGGVPTVWGIHHSNLDPALNKAMTLATAKLCARMSGRLPRKIVCCAEAARRSHVRFGYAEGKMAVIPNGFHVDVFQPSPEARESVRRELGVPADALLVGQIGRFDAQKDHETFFASAAILHRQFPKLYFVLCGSEITWQNVELARWAHAANVASAVRLLGRRGDVARITAALDVATSSSRGEGFPNVLGEAMACGVPCVATDVGDSALIVSRYGLIVPPRDPSALAAACQTLLCQSREARENLGRSARKHIIDHYDIASTVAKYESLYAECAEVREWEHEQAIGGLAE